jgi:putative membrane protein
VNQVVVPQFRWRSLFLNLAINIIALFAAVWIVPGVDLQGPWWGLAVIALLFGIINTGVRPLLLLLTLPFLIVTLGIFLVVVNALMLYLTSWLAQGFGIYFTLNSFGSAILAALLISVISTVLRLLSGDSRMQVEIRRGPPP